MSKNYKNLKNLSEKYISDIYDNKVVIKVQTGTSGQAVGADEVLKTLQAKNSNEINVLEVGSMGLMYLEPMVVVSLPSKDKILFAKETLIFLSFFKNSIGPISETFLPGKNFKEFGFGVFWVWINIIKL